MTVLDLITNTFAGKRVRITRELVDGVDVVEGVYLKAVGDDHYVTSQGTVLHLLEHVIDEQESCSTFLCDREFQARIEVLEDE